jgi:hypothetical protein
MEYFKSQLYRNFVKTKKREGSFNSILAKMKNIIGYLAREMLLI